MFILVYLVMQPLYPYPYGMVFFRVIHDRAISEFFISGIEKKQLLNDQRDDMVLYSVHKGQNTPYKILPPMPCASLLTINY